MKNFVNIVSRISFALVLGACGSEKQIIPRIPFAVEPIKKTVRSENEFVWHDPLKDVDACTFLDSKRADALIEDGAKIKAFQLYRSIYADNSGRLFGSHAIAKLPQILYMMSAEGSTDEGPMYRSYERWSFYRLAKEKLCTKIPTYCEHLNNKDNHFSKLRNYEANLATNFSQVQNLKAELSRARMRNDREAVKTIQRSIVELNVARRHLDQNIVDTKSQIETLDDLINLTAKSIKKTGTQEQISTLEKMEGFLGALRDWDSGRYMGATDVKVPFTKARNKEIQANVNILVPGGLDAVDRPLGDSEMFIRFVRYLKQVYPYEESSGIVRNVTANIDILRPLLTMELVLFGSTPVPAAWSELELDVATSVSLLSSAPTSIQDATCKFIISQRLIAQIIAMKGIRKSPVIQPDGFLEKLSDTDPYHQIAHHDIPGIFGTVVDEAWLQKPMLGSSQDIPLPMGTTDASGSPIPLEYFSYARTFAHIASSANESFWIRNSKDVSSEELVPSELLKLSFGLMAIGLKASDPHLIKVVGNEIHLIPKNSAEAYVTLVHTAIEAIESLDAQYLMHQTRPELGFLTESLLTDIGPNGDMHLKLEGLLYTAVKRAIEYYHNDATSADTKAKLLEAIRKAGAFRRNETLLDFK